MSRAVPAPDVHAQLGFFRNVPVLGGLPDAELVRVCGFADWRLYAAGEILVREGDLAHEMFVVLDGNIDIFKGDGGRLLGELGPGQCIGEMALIDIQTRSATAVASVPTTLMVLGFDDFIRLHQTNLEAYTLVVLNIAREISRRLRETNERLAELGGDESLCP